MKTDAVEVGNKSLRATWDYSEQSDFRGSYT